MTPAERQKEVVKTLIAIEPSISHSERCPGVKNPASCSCYLFSNAEIRAIALDKAGLLRPLLIEIENVNQIDIQ